MKRRWIITIVACLALLVVGLVVLLRPRIVSTNETSELYRRYEKSEHITASFVKDFRVNDAVKVDVTMLEAKNDSTWSQLLDDFNIYQMTPEEIALYGSDQYTNVSVSIRPNYDYKGIPDSNRILNDIVSIYHPQRQLCVFHTSGNEGQFDVVFFIIENCINNSNIKIKRK
ncbi:MAG: hypothetical protein K5867_05170 [Bacteroidales bacterium]|nr:hypothetical protein [Bacteroidales bacterium]